MAADIHSYSSENAVLNLLELGDTNPSLGHTDANVKFIYSLDVAPIVGSDHHAYISSPKFMNLLIEHWDHRKLFDSENLDQSLVPFAILVLNRIVRKAKTFY
jgi:hypothetical protein